MIDVGFDRDLKLWTEEEIIDIIKDKRDVFWRSNISYAVFQWGLFY
jgi:hypothetical protein